MTDKDVVYGNFSLAMVIAGLICVAAACCMSINSLEKRVLEIEQQQVSHP